MAVGATTACPGPGVGSGNSVQANTSGPPCRSMWIVRMPSKLSRKKWTGKYRTSAQEALHLRQLGRLQRPERQRADVLLDLRDGAAARDRHRPVASRPDPGQRALGQRAAAGSEHLAHGLDPLGELRRRLAVLEELH